MNALNHIIQKVVLEIDTNSMRVANSLKNNSSAFIQNELLPLIEKELNSLYVKEDESIQIEKISIVVDANVSRVDLSFSSEVKNEIQKQLQKKVEEAIDTAEITSENTEIESNTVVSITEKKSKTLIYFLNHGRMPWWNSKSNTINFNEENLVEIVNDADFRIQFHSIISKKEVQKRLLNQFNDIQIALFLSSQKGNQNHFSLIATNKIIKQLDTESVQFKIEFWATLFSYLATNEDEKIFSFYDEKLQSWPLSFSEFITELSRFVPVSKSLLSADSEEKSASTHNTTSSENQSFFETEKSEIENNKNQTTTNSDLENNSKKEDFGEKTTPTVPEKATEIQQKNSIENSEIRNQNKPKEASSIENNNTFNENATVNNKKKDSTSDDNSKDKNSESIEENYSNSELLKKGIYVENAGLILLHPFLKMLFQNCNLLDEKNAIINKEVAVHILHYAATKQEHDYEYTMLFEKFLCGLPLEYPIKREVNIEDYQKNHVEELLTAVVGHWSALKNSSTDILRTEFLQREGKLDLLDANPKLTIEKKTQDILLDKIPWNISIIKIPWIEKIMYTEW